MKYFGKKSATWAAELLDDIVLSSRVERENLLVGEASIPECDAPYAVARLHIDQMAYRKAALILENSSCKHSPFLKFYCRFLALQKERAEKCLDPERIEEDQRIEVGMLEQELEEAIDQNRSNPCPFLHYLMGLLLIDRLRLDEAKGCLWHSIRLLPCHWGAWEALITTLMHSNRLDIESLSLNHWILPFVNVAALNAGHRLDEALKEIHKIERHLPVCRTLRELKGSIKIKMHRFQEAVNCFKTVLARDPLRLNSVHLYSSALFMSDNAKEQLCKLASSTRDIDVYRPETCVAMGNYYSCIQRHDRAIESFERALMLDKSFTIAWTLLGHERAFIGQYAKATKAYNRAIELDPRDYRAWYGLGQIQERTGSMNIAAQYIKRAVSLKPDDDRLWTALGSLYAHPKLLVLETSIMCFLKAVERGDTDGRATKALAEIYETTNQAEKAKEWHLKNIDRISKHPKKNLADLAASVNYLGRLCADRNNFDEAQQYYEQLRSLGEEHEEVADNLRWKIEWAIHAANERKKNGQPEQDNRSQA